MTDSTNKGFWERMARIYTAFMSKNNTAYEQICKLSEQYIDSEKSVLELACGTGQITFLMAGKSGSWEATDYSENMIIEAEKCNQGEHKCEQLRFCVQDATNLTYEDEKFDVVGICDKNKVEIYNLENGIPSTLNSSTCINSPASFAFYK